MRGLIEDDEVTMWTDAAVDPTRLPAIAELPGVRCAIGTPPPGAAVLAWGASESLTGMVAVCETAITRAIDPALRVALAQPPPSVAVAVAVNDRRLAVRIAREHGCLPAGVAVLVDGDDADAVTAAAAAASPTGEWIAKAVLTSAGRDRVRGGSPMDVATRTRLARLGPVVVEPWLARTLDLGITGAIDGAGGVTVLAPHTLIADPRGGFRGIELAPPALPAHDLARLHDVARAVGRAIAGLGHRGVYTVDGFVHGDAQLRPLVEINARLSFGVVARALCARLGRTRFGVGTEVPPGAVLLVSSTSSDPSAAWVCDR